MSALSTKRRCQVWNASLNSWINTIYGSVTVDVFYALLRLKQNCPSEVKESGFSLADALFWWVSLTIVPQCIWVFHASRCSEEKRTHPAELTGSFLFLSKLFVKQPFFGDDSLNINRVHSFCFIFSFFPETSVRRFYSTHWKLNSGTTNIDWQLLRGLWIWIFMWRLQVGEGEEEEGRLSSYKYFYNITFSGWRPSA